MEVLFASPASPAEPGEARTPAAELANSLAYLSMLGVCYKINPEPYNIMDAVLAGEAPSALLFPPLHCCMLGPHAEVVCALA